jgi:hypothetical protein
MAMLLIPLVISSVEKACFVPKYHIRQIPVPEILNNFPLSFPYEDLSVAYVDPKLLPKQIQKALSENALVKEKEGLSTEITDCLYSLKVKDVEEAKTLIAYGIFMFDKLELKNLEISYGLHFIYKYFIPMRSEEMYKRTLFYLDRLKAFCGLEAEKMDSVENLTELFPRETCLFEKIQDFKSVKSIYSVLVYMIDYQNQSAVNVMAGILAYLVKKTRKPKPTFNKMAYLMRQVHRRETIAERFQQSLAAVTVDKESLYLFLNTHLT